jgi:hypothetical protein
LRDRACDRDPRPPDAIPIAREPHYRIEYIGTWSRGQFMGNVFRKPDRWALAEGLPNARAFSQWYALLA